jgi:quinol monooxygenase YgiN
MSKFANVVTLEIAPGRRDQVITALLAHKARLKDEPGTLQFEVLLPKDDDTKIFLYEMYRDAAAFEVHFNGPSLAQWKKRPPEWRHFMGCGARRGLVGPLARDRYPPRRRRHESAYFCGFEGCDSGKFASVTCHFRANRTQELTVAESRQFELLPQE